jgi:hypothetical protein
MTSILRRVCPAATVLALLAGALSVPARADDAKLSLTIARGKTSPIMVVFALPCGSSGSGGVVYGKPRFGTVHFEKTRAKIPQHGKFRGEGDPTCKKETGVTGVFYAAGQAPGEDKFIVTFGMFPGYGVPGYGGMRREFTITVK